MYLCLRHILLNVSEPPDICDYSDMCDYRAIYADLCIMCANLIFAFCAHTGNNY